MPETELDEEFFVDGPEDGIDDDEPEPEPEPKAEGKPGEKTDPDKQPVTAREIREMRRALDEANAARREAETSARYWAERAQGDRGPKPEKPAAPAVTQEELLDALTDPSKFVTLLKKQGVVTEAELNQRVAAERRAARSEALLEREFPGIGDESSELFKATAREYQRLEREFPELKGNASLTVMAARQARAALIEQGKWKKGGTRSNVEDFDEYEQPRRTRGESEFDRVRRTQAQGGRGVPRTSERDPETDELDSMQKSIIQKFQSVGANITEDGYRKRAQRGVRVAGMPAGRRR